jgi:hypothetical protein
MKGMSMSKDKVMYGHLSEPFTHKYPVQEIYERLRAAGHSINRRTVYYWSEGISHPSPYYQEALSKVFSSLGAEEGGAL